MTKIIRNRAKCLICGAVVESKYTHDFKVCLCGNVAVDGGLEYLKRSVKDLSKYKDLSIVENEN